MFSSAKKLPGNTVDKIGALIIVIISITGIVIIGAVRMAKEFIHNVEWVRLKHLMYAAIFCFVATYYFIGSY